MVIDECPWWCKWCNLKKRQATNLSLMVSKMVTCFFNHKQLTAKDYKDYLFLLFSSFLGSTSLLVATHQRTVSPTTAQDSQLPTSKEPPSQWNWTPPPGALLGLEGSQPLVFQVFWWPFDMEKQWKAEKRPLLSSVVFISLWISFTSFANWKSSLSTSEKHLKTSQTL